VHVAAGAPRVELHTRALQPALAALLAWSLEHGAVLTGLQARTASLERAFLAVADDREHDGFPSSAD
jgi:ABC-2 type transport system ATP-binding protein